MFFAYFNSFALKQLLYDDVLSHPIDKTYKAVFSEEVADQFTAYTFENESDLIQVEKPPRMPLVNGDMIYYFPVPNTRLTGVVIDGAVFEIKFKLERHKIQLWLENKQGEKQDFMVKEIPNVLLIEKCLRKFIDKEGIVVWCTQ